MVVFEDPSGRYRSGISEVQLSRESDHEVIRVRVLSERQYGLYSSAYDIVQRTDLASFCGRIMAQDQQSQSEGFEIAIGVASEGPFYFHEFLPDRKQVQTGKDGRFCFYNIEPGIIEVAVRRDNQQLTSFLVPLVKGRHFESDFQILSGDTFTTRLGLFPPASVQIYGGNPEMTSIKDIDFVDIAIVGDPLGMAREDAGQLTLAKGATFLNGVVHGVTHGAEYETTLYAFEMDQNPRKVTHYCHEDLWMTSMQSLWLKMIMFLLLMIHL